MNRRNLLGASVVAGMASGLSACGTSPAVLAKQGQEPEAFKPQNQRPDTFVLVHGAFHGGWCWRQVADVLRSQGHRVFTPTLTGAGERSHLLSRQLSLDVWTQDILNVLHWEQLQEVTLVGHSFAGVTLCGVAEQAKSHLRNLVFVDALLLDAGQSAFSSRPAADAERSRQIAAQTSGGLSVPAPPLSAFGLADPVITAAITPLLTPHPLSIYESALDLRNPLGNGVPANYIVCSDPVFAPLEPSRAIARRMGCQFHEIKTNHEVMFTKPLELARMLMA